MHNMCFLCVKVPEKFYLTDSDIEKFVDAVLQSLLYSLYTKDGTASKVKHNDFFSAVCFCFQYHYILWSTYNQTVSE